MELKIELQIDTFIKELHNLHILLQIYNSDNSFFATGYLPLQQFFVHWGNMLTQSNQFHHFRLNIWKYGHFVGQADVYINLFHQFFVKQSKVGIQSEEQIYPNFENLPFNRYRRQSFQL